MKKYATKKYARTLDKYLKLCYNIIIMGEYYYKKKKGIKKD